MERTMGSGAVKPFEWNELLPFQSRHDQWSFCAVEVSVSMEDGWSHESYEIHGAAPHETRPDHDNTNLASI